MWHALKLIETKLLQFLLIETHDPLAKRKYDQINGRIELLSEVYYFILVNLTMPGIILPAFLLTIINYFVYDLQGNAYRLPLPTAYVQHAVQLHIDSIADAMRKKSSLAKIGRRNLARFKLISTLSLICDVFRHHVDCLSIGRHRMDTWLLCFLNRPLHSPLDFVSQCPRVFLSVHVC